MIDLHGLSPWLLLVAPAAVIVGYTVFGLSGFGSTLISVPILAHFLPVSYLVPLMALLDMCSATLMGTANREHVNKAELKHIVPFMFVGFVVGATLLVGVPDRYLRVALGIFAIAIGAYSIVNPVLRRKFSAWWSIPVGITGGAVATVFGAGGPIYAMYLSGRLEDKHQIRSTMSALISISAFTRAMVYAIAGLLLNAATLLGGLVLAPFVWIGLKIGGRIHTRLTQAQLRRVIGAVVVCSGASLVLRAVL